MIVLFEKLVFNTILKKKHALVIFVNYLWIKTLLVF
jgi:hypothetical protein